MAITVPLTVKSKISSYLKKTLQMAAERSRKFVPFEPEVSCLLAVI